MREERMARSGLGRIVLHCLCAWQDHHYGWHWRCMCREILHPAKQMRHLIGKKRRKDISEPVKPGN